MTEKILFVDDEPAVLDGYKRLLHRDFAVETAVGGVLGLEALKERGPFAIVVSDMRMPGMSGSQFLSETRTRAPQSVRILLTGYSDATAAIAAVNDGHILRFLTKPCSKEDLISALKVGIAQYRLTMAEKEILEHTLRGSIKVLTEVLGAVSPEAFSRSIRITELVRHLLKYQPVASPWQVEVAAMVSQLGCMSLDQDLILKAYIGTKLTPADKLRFEAHPSVAGDLLLNIPRLETVAWMVRQQLTQDAAPPPPNLSAAELEDLRVGGAILRVAVEFDNLRARGLSTSEVMVRLRSRDAEFPRRYVDALQHVVPDQERLETRKLPVSKLAVGMLLQQEVRNLQGMLMVAKDQPITEALIIKLESYASAGLIEKELLVLAPASGLAAASTHP